MILTMSDWYYLIYRSYIVLIIIFGVLFVFFELDCLIIYFALILSIYHLYLLRVTCDVYVVIAVNVVSTMSAGGVE